MYFYFFRPRFEQVEMWCDSLLFHLEHGSALPLDLQGDPVLFHQSEKESFKMKKEIKKTPKGNPCTRTPSLKTIQEKSRDSRTESAVFDQDDAICVPNENSDEQNLPKSEIKTENSDSKNSVIEQSTNGVSVTEQTLKDPPDKMLNTPDSSEKTENIPKSILKKTSSFNGQEKNVDGIDISSQKQDSVLSSPGSEIKSNLESLECNKMEENFNYDGRSDKSCSGGENNMDKSEKSTTDQEMKAALVDHEENIVSDKDEKNQANFLVVDNQINENSPGNVKTSDVPVAMVTNSDNIQISNIETESTVNKPVCNIHLQSQIISDLNNLKYDKMPTCSDDSPTGKRESTVLDANSDATHLATHNLTDMESCNISRRNQTEKSPSTDKICLPSKCDRNPVSGRQDNSLSLSVMQNNDHQNQCQNLVDTCNSVSDSKSDKKLLVDSVSVNHSDTKQQSVSSQFSGQEVEKNSSSSSSKKQLSGTEMKNSLSKISMQTGEKSLDNVMSHGNQQQKVVCSQSQNGLPRDQSFDSKSSDSLSRDQPNDSKSCDSLSWDQSYDRKSCDSSSRDQSDDNRSKESVSRGHSVSSLDSILSTLEFADASDSD